MYGNKDKEHSIRYVGKDRWICKCGSNGFTRESQKIHKMTYAKPPPLEGTKGSGFHPKRGAWRNGSA